MALTQGTTNQTKSFGGTGSISLGSIRDFFGGTTNKVKFSDYYRKTSDLIPTSQFGSTSNSHYVPNATENDTVKTGGNNHAFGDFRGVDYNGDGNGDGVIKEYIVEQQQGTTDTNLNLATSTSAPATTGWNNNLGKNVPKKAIIKGRVVSNLQARASGQSYGPNMVYDHGNDSALKLDAAPYNMDLIIDSGTTNPPASAGQNVNERGVFGVGGGGQNSANFGPFVGGTAAYVVQNQNRSAALNNGSAIINVNLQNGRLYAGGGGGTMGNDGIPGADGVDGKVADCVFASSKNIDLHGNAANPITGKTFRSMAKCDGSDMLHGCGNQKIANIKGVANSGVCVGNHNRKRCRNSKGGSRDRGENNCFGYVKKTCYFNHTFSGNPATGGTGGAAGTAGQGASGQGANNIRTRSTVGKLTGNSGENGTSGTCSNCNSVSGYAVTKFAANPCGSDGSPGTDGNDGNPGGAYGKAGTVSTPQAPKGGQGGHAVFSLPNSKTSVVVNYHPYSKGKLTNITPGL